MVQHSQLCVRKVGQGERGPSRPIHDCGELSHKGNIYITPLSTTLPEPCGRGSGKSVTARCLGGPESNIFRISWDAALKNSQQLWLSAQNQVSEYSKMEWKRFCLPSPLTVELWAVDGFWGGRVFHFLQVCGSW